MNSIVLGSPLVSGIVATLIVLVVGDFASTFFYHVPQHVWGKLHLRTHHDRKRSYWDHAVLSRSPEILLDGLLGALPYIAIAVACASLSVAGAIVGLVLGQLHVWWRHTVELGWKSPAWLVRFARITGLVLPEDHNGHHREPRGRVRRHLPLLRCAGSQHDRVSARDLASAASRRGPARDACPQSP